MPKLYFAVVIVICLAAAALAQENVRELNRPGQHTKYLTPGQLDHWSFAAEQGETIIAYVSSREFDPILELAVKQDTDEKVLTEVDDPGNESRFATRLAKAGQYSIRIHAFRYQGGGNYTLQVQRFRAQPLEAGKATVGAFDRTGKGYHVFVAKKDQIVIPDLKGGAGATAALLDPKGRVLGGWAGASLLEAEGEHYVLVTGPADNRYDLTLREARRHEVEKDRPLAGNLKQGEMDVWSFAGKPGDFRVLEIQKEGELAARVIWAVGDRTKEQQLSRPEDPPEIAFIPISSRGKTLRFAAVLGRPGRYELQLLARTAVSYTATIADPTAPIARDKPFEGALPVGSSMFHGFQAQPGQLIQASLSSDKFVPVLRLYDARGRAVAQSDEDAGGPDAQISHMIVSEGAYRLQVASTGDGGGGAFGLSLREHQIRQLQIGARGKGSIDPAHTDFWTFDGQEGKTLILSVRSPGCEPAVQLYTPDGVRLAGDAERPAGAESLLSVKLPRSGRYTLWITSRRGAGDYTARLIDADE